jgi:anti-sigma28 factor (negative regulator of flagellin synthesis)
MDIPTKVATSAVRTIIQKGVGFLRQKRIDELLEKLENGSIDIDDPKVTSENFISTLINTADALQKASGHKKINVLTQLFISGVQSDSVNSKVDEFHEILSSLASLSERELIVLANCGENLKYMHDGIDGRTVVQSSGDLYNRVSSSLSLSRETSIAVVSGLQRTGFIVPFNQPQQYPLYMLSQKYKDLVSYIHLSNELQ